MLDVAFFVFQNLSPQIFQTHLKQLFIKWNRPYTLNVDRSEFIPVQHWNVSKVGTSSSKEKVHKFTI